MTGVITLSIILMFLLFSWWNACSAGNLWAEAKFERGQVRVMAWSAALVSAAGFMWCYLVSVGLVFDAWYLTSFYDISLVLGVLVALAASWTFTTTRWRREHQEKMFSTMKTGEWNKYVETHNHYHNTRGFGDVVCDTYGPVFDMMCSDTEGAEAFWMELTSIACYASS